MLSVANMIESAFAQKLPAIFKQPVLSKHFVQAPVHDKYTACLWRFTCSLILTMPQSTEAARALTCCCWSWYLATSLLKVSKVRVPLTTSPLIPSIDSCAFVTTRSLHAHPQKPLPMQSQLYNDSWQNCTAVSWFVAELHSCVQLVTNEQAVVVDQLAAYASWWTFASLSPGLNACEYWNRAEHSCLSA